MPLKRHLDLRDAEKLSRSKPVREHNESWFSDVNGNGELDVVDRDGDGIPDFLQNTPTPFELGELKRDPESLVAWLRAEYPAVFDCYDGAQHHTESGSHVADILSVARSVLPGTVFLCPARPPFLPCPLHSWMRVLWHLFRCIDQR